MGQVLGEKNDRDVFARACFSCWNDVRKAVTGIVAARLGVTISGPRIFIRLPSALHQAPSITSANEMCTDVSSIAKLAEAVSAATNRWRMT